jgi:tetratricopeptide (TPR) repeat protein
MLLLFILPLLFNNCAHKKAYKKALEYEKTGQYVQSAEKDLEALDKKSDFTDAKEHLQLVAPKAYKELLNSANTYERNLQWVEALDSWNHLDRILTRFKRHGVFLTTINVEQRIAQAKQKGVTHYYNKGQGYYQTGDYVQSIQNFKNVEKISGFYLDTKEKLWNAHIRLGDQKLQYQEFDTAIKLYKAAAKYSADVNSNNQYVAEGYYQWAQHYAANENYREATERFEDCLAVVPNYRDAERQRQYVYEKAVQRVAILPFNNGTPYGVQYSNLLTESTINNCIQANLKYANFVTRAHIDKILEEHKLAMAGLVDASKASEIGKLEGIHYFVTGNVTQISEQTNRPAFVEKTHDLTYTEKDTAGKDIQKTRPIYYREYKKSRTVQIAASFQVVEVETGRYLSGENFNEKIVDEAIWVRYQGSVYDLPKNKQKLVDGHTEPRSTDIIINDGMRQIADKIGAKVLAQFK